MKEFSFSYFTAKNTVSIDDYVVKIKTGPFIKKEFQLANLQHFYVFDNKDYQSVFFVYTDEKGKTKKVQVFSTPAEMGFTEMINELNARVPAKSLNNLTQAEAFKVMKTTNPNKWAPIVAFLLIFFVLCGMFYPGLRHYFDFGFENATVTEVAAGKDIGTRNINISGYLLDQALEETTTTTSKGSTTTTVSVYVPMVDENWEEGNPIKVILSFDELSDAEYEQVLNETDFTGVIRDIAWEGIEDSQTDFLKKTYGLNFPDKPILVEITNEKHNDAWAFYAVLLCAGILGIVFLIIAIKRKKSQ